MGLSCSLFCPAKYEKFPLETEGDFDDGFVIGNKILGRGSTAVVLDAYDLKGRTYACKILDKEYMIASRKGTTQADDDVTVLVDNLFNQVLEEVQILKELSHPCIAQMHSFRTNSGVTKIILDFIDGVELFHYLVECGPMSEWDSKNLMNSLFSAVDHVHSKGIIHRDIKAENILVHRNRVPGEPIRISLIDFGLSTKQGRKDMSEDYILGSFAYMGPEVMLSKKIDYAVDMWSCGVLLFQILCGHIPFSVDPSDIFSETEEDFYREFFTLRFLPEYFWMKISFEPQGLVSQCLEFESSDRITARDALNHPWFKTLEHENNRQMNRSRKISSNNSNNHNIHLHAPVARRSQQIFQEQLCL